jgi:hypothetical protein
MAVNDRDRRTDEQIYRDNEERVYGTNLHPRHESWARISTRSTMIAFVVFLVLAALFFLWIEWGF